MLARLQRQREELIRMSEKARLEAEQAAAHVAAVKREIARVRRQSATASKAAPQRPVAKRARRK